MRGYLSKMHIATKKQDKTNYLFENDYEYGIQMPTCCERHIFSFFYDQQITWWSFIKLSWLTIRRKCIWMVHVCHEGKPQDSRQNGGKFSKNISLQSVQHATWIIFIRLKHTQFVLSLKTISSTQQNKMTEWKIINAMSYVHCAHLKLN